MKAPGQHRASGAGAEWESRAIRIATALDMATSELAALIEDIRKRRTKEEEGPNSDARTEP